MESHPQYRQSILNAVKHDLSNARGEASYGLPPCRAHGFQSFDALIAMADLLEADSAHHSPADNQETLPTETSIEQC